jgi:hypothetical protein
VRRLSRLVAPIGLLVVASAALTTVTGCAERGRKTCAEAEETDLAAWLDYVSASKAYAAQARGAVDATDAGPARIDVLQKTQQVFLKLAGGPDASAETLDGIHAAGAALGRFVVDAREDARLADASVELAGRAFDAARRHDAAAAKAAEDAAIAGAGTLAEGHKTAMRSANAWTDRMQAIRFPNVPAPGADIASRRLDDAMPYALQLAAAEASSAARYARCASLSLDGATP